MGFETAESILTPEYRLALRAYPPDYDEGAFWLEITGRADYDPRSSKASRILDPALRIFHRWLTMGPYGRRDSTGNVARHHLFIMWAAHHQRRLDAGFYFLVSARGVVSVRQKEGNKGYICIGSYFTRLCRHHEIDLDATCTIIKRMKPLGMSTFQSMQILVRGDAGPVLAPPRPRPPPPVQPPPPPPPQQPPPQQPDEPEAFQEPAQGADDIMDAAADWQPPPPPFPPPPPPPSSDFGTRLELLQTRIDEIAERQVTDLALLQSRMDAQDEHISQLHLQTEQQLATIISLLQRQPPPP